MKKTVLAATLVLLMSLGACAFEAPGKEVNYKYEVDENFKIDPGVLSFTALKASAEDAFVLETENHTFVMDTGTNKKGKKVVELLKSHGVEKIDAVFISHYDKDHVGGADRVIDNFDIGAVYTTYRSKATDEMTEYYAALKRKGMNETVVTEETTFEADGMTFTIYPALSKTYAEDISNNSSLAVKVTNGNKSILFTGDALEGRIDELVKTDGLECDILKVPHHGRYKANIKQLVDHVKPEYAVITSSKGDPAAPEVVDALEQAGAKIYYTRDDPITFTITADNIEVSR